MQEPPKIRVPKQYCPCLETFKKLEVLETELFNCFGAREVYKATADQAPSLEKSTFEQSTSRNDAQGYWIDTFAQERQILTESRQLADKCVKLSIKEVKDAEQKASRAQIEITEELSKYGLPWQNSNQESLYIRKCEKMRPFESMVNEMRGFELQSRTMARDLEQRVEWLGKHVILLRQNHAVHA